MTPFIRRWPRPSVYLFAVAATLLTLAARMAMAVPFGNRPLLILFMFPIILSALMGGLGPGLLSTAVAALGIDIMAIPPVGSLDINAWHDLTQWAMFILCGVLVSTLSERLQRMVKTVRHSQERVVRLFHSTAVPLCLVDNGGVFTDMNERFTQVFGYTREDIATVEDWWRLAYPDSEYRRWVVAHWQEAVRRAAENKTDVQPEEYRVTCKDGTVRTMVISGRSVGEGLLATFFDVTERREAEESTRRALAEQTTLLQEVHHRVKNNLQIICSLLNLQADSLDNEATRDLLMISVNRVRSMARVHEMLYSGRDLAGIELGAYFQALLRDLAGAFADVSGHVEVCTDLEKVPIPIDKAVPCALIANELVTNAFKHAFAGRSEGELRVRLASQGERVTFEVSDNGPGLPAGLDPQGGGTLGFQLVQTLVEQLGGELDVRSGRGTSMRVSFPCAARSAVG